MSATAVTAVTSLDGFHATLLARSFLSYDVHGTRCRAGLRRYHADLRRSFPDLRFRVHEKSVDWVRACQPFGLPSEEVDDA